MRCAHPLVEWANSAPGVPRSMGGPIAPANRCHSGQNVRVWIAVKMWTTRGRALPVHRESRTPILAPAVGPSVVALRTYQRLRRPVLGWTLLGVGLAGSGFVGFARIASGAHFPSDVIAGAAVGVGMGLALPALHDTPLRMAPYASREGGGLLFSGTLR